MWLLFEICSSVVLVSKAVASCISLNQFLIDLSPKPCNFIKKKLQQRCLTVKFVKFLWIPILKNICERLLLYFHYDSYDYFHYHHFYCHQRQPFANFTGNHLCWSLFLIKLQTWDLQLYLKETPTNVFSCEMCQIFKNNFSYSAPRWLLLYHWKMHLYRLIILLNIHIDCNMIPCLIEPDFVFFLPAYIFSSIFFVSSDCRLKSYNVINGQNFFDQPVRNNLIAYDNIWKIPTGQEDDYTSCCLLGYNYF